MRLYEKARSLLGQKRSPVQASDAYLPAATVSWMRQGDRTVLLDAERGEYYGLDEVGGEIWELLRTGTPLSGIVTALEARYQVDRAELEADVIAIVTDLRDSSLIRR